MVANIEATQIFMSIKGPYKSLYKLRRQKGLWNVKMTECNKVKFCDKSRLRTGIT